MKPMITFEEKRYARNLIRETKTLEFDSWGKWGGYTLLTLGACLTVFIILFAMANPGAPNIPMILISGTSNGVILLMLGAYGIHANNVAKEKKVLAGLLKKLMYN